MDEWTTIQTYDLDGVDLFPVYSDPSLASDQRVGSSATELVVYFDTSSGQETYSPNSVDEFQQFRTRQRVDIAHECCGRNLSVEQ